MARKSCVMCNRSKFLDRPIRTFVGLYCMECFDAMEESREKGTMSELLWLRHNGFVSSRKKSRHLSGRKTTKQVRARKLLRLESD